VEHDKDKQASRTKYGKVLVQPGKPLQFTEELAAEPSNVGASSIPSAVCETLKAYREAARKLLESKYAGQKELAPPHMQGPCDIFVVRCNDGILVRYDLASQEEPKIRCGQMTVDLSEAAPGFSEQVIYFPEDPSTFVPSSGGPEIALSTIAPDGATKELTRCRPYICVSTTLSAGFQMPPPSSRPPCLVSVQNDFNMQLHGVLEPLEAPPNVAGPDAQQFIAYSRFRINVGWQTIEIYPLPADEYWKPEYAPMWAELDLLAAIAQKNLVASTLHGIDSRGATRRAYAALLKEFETLLTGPEEPVHQFLKQHPELLCPTSQRCWSKLAFGARVSDFVFREPYNDYLLVEIEAPIREIFRKDGQQREELTHAINQITDWIQYITDNKQRVEEGLGLVGISTNPRILVVIGRSASLTEENRKKIAVLQAQQNKLRILTYDDLIGSARANVEKILGPLDLEGQNAELYFFKGPTPITS
jgi:hypothetical protein